jgi:hypothetical protein
MAYIKRIKNDIIDILLNNKTDRSRGQDNWTDEL